MNIILFYESIDLGGQQTQTLKLMEEFHRLGHTVTWIYLEGEALLKPIETYGLAQCIKISWPKRFYRRRPWRVLSVALQIYFSARKHAADLIISGSGIGSVACGLAAKASGMRHYRLMGCSLSQVEPTLLAWYQSARIDRLVDCYFGWPEVFRELESVGVKQHKFVEVGNAVDTTVFFPNVEAGHHVRRTLRIADTEFVIGWVGRVAEDMQIGTTVKLVKHLLEDGISGLTLLVVGGGPWLQGLKLLVKKLAIEENVIFTDWVPFTDVAAYINAMDVVPLLEADPQGGSIMRETMACGRVALSVDGPSGTQSRFMSTKNACLVGSSNWFEHAKTEILALKEDPIRRDEIGKAAAVYAQANMRFSTQAGLFIDQFSKNRC